MGWVALILLLFSTPALADGAVAVGFVRDGTIATTMAISRSTAENARNRALADCQLAASQCRIVHEFKDTCVATVIFAFRQLDIGRGATTEEAAQDALNKCNARGTACTRQNASCDVTVAQAPPAGQPKTAPTPVPSDTITIPLSYILIALAFVAFALFLARHKIADLFLTQTVAVNPRLPAQTAAAQQQMRAAWNYIEKAIGATKKVNITAEEVEKIIETLNRSAEHLVKARELDPGASIEVELGEGQVFSQPALIAVLLYMEGECEMMLATKAPFNFIARWHMKRAIAALKQAVTYEAQPRYYCRLSEACAWMGDQASARVYAQKALDLDPADVEATQLLNALPSITERFPYPPYYELKVGLFGFATLCTLAAVYVFVNSESFAQETRAFMYSLGFTPWLALLIYFAARNKLRRYLRAIPWTYTHYRERKKWQRRRAFINSLYERRWKGLKVKWLGT